MSRSLFTCIIEEVTLYCAFFREKEDCTRKLGISPLLKCTSAIHQLAYDTVPDTLDEYLQMGHATSRQYWAWFGCPITHKAQYYRHDHGPDPFILLEVVASKDLWIWHSFFGVAEANKNINVTQRFPLLNDLKLGKALEVPFVANDLTYPWGYYLCDEIYPEWVPFVKSVTNLSNDDHKRLRYKAMHEVTRKDVERAFGVLKNKWAILATPAQEEHQPDDLIRSDEQRYRIIRMEAVLIRQEKTNTRSLGAVPVVLDISGGLQAYKRATQ
ncbi:ALP1-like protein [Tanacetum coccineum]